MKHTITIIDDDPNSPLLKTDDRTPVLIRRRTDVDWERVSKEKNMLIENGIPRRSNMLRWIPAEQAIHEVINQIEALGAHIRLTDAVVLLTQAKDAIADWAEETGNVAPAEPPTTE